MLSRTLRHLQQLDHYIRIGKTGSPTELALKLKVCERQIHRYIVLLKKLGAPVEYCRKRKTYCYTTEGGFSFKFEILLPQQQHLTPTERYK
jgi:predicted DNA-binding transcriptional regulator YafY